MAYKNWRDVLPVHAAADLFPLMSESELRELADDIKANGLHTPIVLWGKDYSSSSSTLIDGRNRLDAMMLAGLLYVSDEGKLWTRLYGHPTPLRQHADNTIDDPYAYALSCNVHRRHLTGEQKRELITKVLKAKPETSDRQIATAAKVDHKTVGSVRSEMEGRGEIPHVEKRTDTKGRKQPAAKANNVARLTNGQPLKIDDCSDGAKQKIVDAVGAAERLTGSITLSPSAKDKMREATERLLDKIGEPEPKPEPKPTPEDWVDLVGDRVECSTWSAKTVLEMWSEIERHDSDVANEVRDDVAAAIRALIIEWQKALALVAPPARSGAA